MKGGDIVKRNAAIAIIFTLLFASLIVQNAHAMVGNSIIGVQAATMNITSLRGTMHLASVSWTNPWYEDTHYWSTLVLGKDGTFGTMAEVNLRASWNWLFGWRMFVTFSWRDSGASGGNVVEIPMSWSNNVELMVWRYYGTTNKYEGWYRMSGVDWTLIGSKTYSQGWLCAAQYVGLEVTHAPSTGQYPLPISNTQDMWETCNYGGEGVYTGWDNDWYGNSEDYNIFIGFNGWGYFGTNVLN